MKTMNKKKTPRESKSSLDERAGPTGLGSTGTTANKAGGKAGGKSGAAIDSSSSSSSSAINSKKRASSSTTTAASVSDGTKQGQTAPEAKRIHVVSSGADASETSSAVKRADVVRAVEALVAHNLARPQKRERLLEGENEDVNLFVNVGLRKMPEMRTFKGRGLELPHAFRPQPDMKSLEICLLVKDKAEARKWLDDESDPALKRIKLISLQQLRTEYATFESKRRLAHTYDVFLADDRVVCMLPKALGKTFYSSAAKRPLPLRLAMTKSKRVEETGEEEEDRDEEDEDDEEYVDDVPRGPLFKTVKTSKPRTDLKARVQRVLNSTFFYLTGSLCSIPVGNLERNTPAQLVDNALAAIEGAVNRGVPGKWGNVQSIHLKLTKSAALPVYERL